MQELNKPWPECLPLALFSIRYTPTGKTGLSPYEILFGNAPRLGLYFPQSMQLQCDSLTAYVLQLQQRLTKIHESVYSSLPDPNSITGTHTLLSGDYVYVKKHTRKTLEPRFEGPYQVLLTTATSVKLEGKPTWIYASHYKKTTRANNMMKYLLTYCLLQIVVLQIHAWTPGINLIEVEETANLEWVIDDPNVANVSGYKIDKYITVGNYTVKGHKRPLHIDQNIAWISAEPQSEVNITFQLNTSMGFLLIIVKIIGVIKYPFCRRGNKHGNGWYWNAQSYGFKR